MRSLLRKRMTAMPASPPASRLDLPRRQAAARGQDQIYLSPPGSCPSSHRAHTRTPIRKRGFQRKEMQRQTDSMGEGGT